LLTRPARATLFPYTTLFRSTPCEGDLKAGQLVCHECSGGRRTRTSKGLRPPVFKTGALPFGQPSRGKHRRLALRRRRESVARVRSEEHTSELQSRENLVCRL